jgi:hypothetical protein
MARRGAAVIPRMGAFWDAEGLPTMRMRPRKMVRDIVWRDYFPVAAIAPVQTKLMTNGGVEVAK